MRSTTKVLLLTLLTLFATTSAWAGPDNKIEICHFPPGNPDNFHTITIHQNAWTAHHLHGDQLGSCIENCGTICGDNNACTIDYDASAQQCVCLSGHPPVNCDDGLACTNDSCNPVTGCQYVNNCDDGNDCTANLCSSIDGTCSFTNVEDGTTCNDGDAGTTNDACNAGVCAGTADDACSNNFCRNGSTCLPNTGGDTYTCGCLPGFTGVYCEIDPCAFPHCENGSTCERGDDGTSYTCNCPPGYSGQNCEVQDSQGFDCGSNNPCTPENSAAGLFYFPASAGSNQFIQCSEFGQCYVQSCPPGLTWDQDALTCLNP